MATKEKRKQKMTVNDFKDTILSDYRLINECREAILLGRRDVLSGKGSFGIFGDGKELAQIALSKVFILSSPSRDAVQVYLNGILLEDGNEYTATDGTSITMSSTVWDADEVELA